MLAVLYRTLCFCNFLTYLFSESMYLINRARFAIDFHILYILYIYDALIKNAETEFAFLERWLHRSFYVILEPSILSVSQLWVLSLG
jgi:hypothetical protein